MKNRTVSLILYRQKKSSKNFRSLRKKRKISATIYNVDNEKSYSYPLSPNFGTKIALINIF